MNIVVCPKCKMQVIPKEDGTCPSCGKKITDKGNKQLPLNRAERSKKKSQTPRIAQQYRIKKRDLYIGDVLKRAWMLFWKFKVLWLFNIIPLFTYFIFITLLTNPNLNSYLADAYNKESLWILFIYIGIIVLYSCGIILGSAACIEGTYQADKGAKKLSFDFLLRNSLQYFWKMIGLDLIVSAGFIAMAAILVVLMIVVKGFALLCTIPFLLTFIPTAFIVQAIVEQSQKAIVIDKLGIRSAWHRGWEILKNNFWAIILMLLILNVGSYILMIIVYLPFYSPITALTKDLATISSQALPLNALFSTKTILAFLFPVYGMFQGVVLTYIQSAWTITYLRLTRPVPAKALNA